MLGALISPALFYGGAAAVSVPIVIHLLARRRFRRVRWAAMDFLIDALRRNRRRIRMEERILLALRCLAILLIALMVSRPFVQPGGLASAFGGLRQTERVIVMDDSLSMDLQSDDGAPFERAQIAVRRLLEGIRRETPDDTVTLLRASDVASPLKAGAYLDDQQTDELLERLAGIEPTFEALDVPALVRDVAQYLQRDDSIVSAAVYFVSDFQAIDWARGHGDSDNDADGAELFSPLAQWAGEDRAILAVCVNVCDPAPENAAVIGLSRGDGKWIAGTTGRLDAHLANYAGRPRAPQPMYATYGSIALDAPQAPHIAANAQATVEIQIDLVQSGRVPLRVSYGEDGLLADNTRFFVAHVARALRVLIVNGEPAPDLVDDEVGLLRTALRPEGEVFSGNECTIVDEVEAESTKLAPFDVVILANVYRLSEPFVTQLESFVRGGGGLLVFLGDQVDPDMYNESLFRDGTGLLPVRLVESVRVRDGAHIRIVEPLHPAMRGLGREGDPLGIGRIPFTGFMHTERMPAEGEQVDAPSDARVLARFDDERESAAIVERSFGAGSIVLVTSSVDKEWNLLADHPVFVPLINEMLHFLTRGVPADSEHWIGAPLEIPLDPTTHTGDAVVRTPRYPQEREAGISAAPTDDGSSLQLKWEDTSVPGIYTVLVQRREGGDEARSIAVNIDPRESDLTGCREEDLRGAAGDVPMQYVDGIEALRADSGAGSIEFWRAFLLLAVGVLMTEQGLAWWWGIRR